MIRTRIKHSNWCDPINYGQHTAQCQIKARHLITQKTVRLLIIAILFFRRNCFSRADVQSLIDDP
jgi:hypothetical protein